MRSLWRAFGSAHSHITVKIGGGEKKLRRCAMRQMRDSRRGDIAAPAVFNGHGDAHRDTKVARQTSLGQPAEFADLDVDHIHRPIGMPAQEHVNVVHRLVEYKGMIRTAADRQALFVRQAGLLNIYIDIANRSHHSRRFVHEPASVGIGDELVARLQHMSPTKRMRSISSCGSAPTLSWKRR